MFIRDRNYSSYVYSDTNLMSPTFFTNAVVTTTNGTHAALVSASGKTSTNVVINAVKALATATRYTTSADHLSGASDGKVTAETDIKNLTDNVDLSKFAGSMTLNSGDRTISIDFGERELFQKEDGSFDAEAFQSAIVEKLKDQQLSLIHI